MTLTIKSFPTWTPEILRRLYLSRLEDQRDHKPDLLLEKLVSDPRMEFVWKAIDRRCPAGKLPKSDYPFSLFLIISIWLSVEVPKESPDALKQRYTQIAALAKELDEAMQGSVLEKEGLRHIVSGIAESANELTRRIDFDFFPYVKTINRTVKYPVRTMLTRQLYQKFQSDFGTPLWDVIVRIVEVVCDVPPDEINIDWVRSCVS